MNGLDSELEQLRQRLGELQAEQQGIQFRIQQLLLERQRMASPPSPAEADIVLQLWRYRPDVLGDGAIDPLSLALSLMGESDERVQMAIDEMLEELQW